MASKITEMGAVFFPSRAGKLSSKMVWGPKANWLSLYLKNSRIFHLISTDAMKEARQSYQAWYSNFPYLSFLNSSMLMQIFYIFAAPPTTVLVVSTLYLIGAELGRAGTLETDSCCQPFSQKMPVQRAYLCPLPVSPRGLPRLVGNGSDFASLLPFLCPSIQ